MGDLFLCNGTWVICYHVTVHVTALNNPPEKERCIPFHDTDVVTNKDGRMEMLAGTKVEYTNKDWGDAK